MNNPNQSKLDNWISWIVAFVVSLVLFLFVNHENQTQIQSTRPDGNASISSVEVLTGVPIQINVNRDEYFVSGLPDTANVQLTGSQGILSQTLATQNIVVETPDLNQLGVGTHEIELLITGLSDQIEYHIDPPAVTVTIENKVTKEMPVSFDFNPSYVAEGYEAGEPQLSEETVVVSGAQSAVNRVERVVVTAPQPEEAYTSDINLVQLQVLLYDAQGDLVDAYAEPSQISVYVPVNPYQESVPVDIQITGQAEDYSYEVNVDQAYENVILSGPQSLLASIDTLDLEVDVSDITEDTVINVPVDAGDDRILAQPEMIPVEIQVSQTTSRGPASGRNSSNGNSNNEGNRGSDAETSSDEEENSAAGNR